MVAEAIWTGLFLHTSFCSLFTLPFLHHPSYSLSFLWVSLCSPFLSFKPQLFHLQNKITHTGGRWCHHSCFAFQLCNLIQKELLPNSCSPQPWPCLLMQMFAPEGRLERPGLGCSAPVCWCWFHFSPRLQTSENAKSSSRFSSRIKWLPLTTSPFKMIWKSEEIFDVVQLRNPSDRIKPGNAGAKGSIRGSSLVGVLPGLCFCFMVNVL